VGRLKPASRWGGGDGDTARACAHGHHRYGKYSAVGLSERPLSGRCDGTTACARANSRRWSARGRPVVGAKKYSPAACACSRPTFEPRETAHRGLRPQGRRRDHDHKTVAVARPSPSIVGAAFTGRPTAAVPPPHTETAVTRAGGVRHRCLACVAFGTEVVQQ
jgi:hypothetical protein